MGQRKLVCFLATLLLGAASTDALGLIDHLVREYKCPRCKMKIETKGACPCCLKKKPPKTTIIHDSCGDEDEGFTIHFDRLSAVLTDETLSAFIASFIFDSPADVHVRGTFADIPHPPPRI